MACDGQRTDQPFHLFREEAVEEVFHRVAHRLEQVGDDRTVDERHQDAGAFGDSVAKTLKTVDEKEENDAQADGPEPCEHPVEVGLECGFLSIMADSIPAADAGIPAAMLSALLLLRQICFYRPRRSAAHGNPGAPR